MRDQVAVPQLMFLVRLWSRSPFPSTASHERGPQALTRKHRTIMGEFSEYLRVLSDVTETMNELLPHSFVLANYQSLMN